MPQSNTRPDYGQAAALGQLLFTLRHEQVRNILRLEASLESRLHQRIGGVPESNELSEIEKTEPLSHRDVVED